MTSELFDRALNNAVFWQNRCCDLEEIIDMFCLDAEATGEKECNKPVPMNTSCPLPTVEIYASTAEIQSVEKVQSLK